MSNWSLRVAKRLAVFRLVRSVGDLVLLVRIFWMVGSVERLLKHPLSGLQARLEPERPPTVRDPDRERQIIRSVDAVLNAARPFIQPRCLHRGVTLYYFLRRVGVPVSLCFGMGARQQNRLGHCWLEMDAQPFLESEDPRVHYVEMYCIPTRQPGSEINGTARPDRVPI